MSELSEFYYIQMEFCPLGSLEGFSVELEAIVSLPVNCSELNWFLVHDSIYAPSAQLVLQQMAKALTACHERNLFKPSNILVMSLSHVKLGDFGMVQKTNPTGNHASVNSLPSGQRGTKGFIAPKMGANDNIDWLKADIYSLGATISILLVLWWPAEDENTGPTGDRQLRVLQVDWPK